MTSIDSIDRNPFGPLVPAKPGVTAHDVPFYRNTISSVCFQAALGIEVHQQAVGRQERTRPGGADLNYQTGNSGVNSNLIDRAAKLMALHKDGYQGINPRVIHGEEVLISVEAGDMVAKVRAPLAAVQRRIPTLARL